MSEFNRFQVIQQDNNVTIIRLLDAELSDLLIQDAFLEEIMLLLAGDAKVNLVVNFSIVNYCSTGIINALISAKRRLAEKNGEIRFCELNKHVLGEFQALNLVDTVFPVLAEEAAAIASFES